MKELQVTIKACVVIVPGKTRVRLVPPAGGGEGWESRDFFERYNGKTGTLVGYCAEYVGVHDMWLRKPGVYVKRGEMGKEMFTPVKVLFDGETEPKTVMFTHLAVIEHFRLPEGARSPDQWYISELPEEVVFYPGDTVYLREDLLQTPHEVKYISFTESGEVRYDLNRAIEERKSIQATERAENNLSPRMVRIPSGLDFPSTRRRAQELTLLKRGVLYLLYHENPDDLEFGSLEAEVAFWSRLDLTVQHGPEDKYGWNSNRLSASLKLLRSGEADVIYHLENVVPHSYDPRRLRPAFERFRARAQKASIAYWEKQTEKDDRRYG